MRISDLGKIVPCAKTPPNTSGIYEGQVTVNGIPKSGNHGTFRFFLEHWVPQIVINAIKETYNNSVLESGNTYNGVENGIYIQMYIDSNVKIISAFPIY